MKYRMKIWVADTWDRPGQSNSQMDQIVVKLDATSELEAKKEAIEARYDLLKWNDFVHPNPVVYSC